MPGKEMKKASIPIHISGFFLLSLIISTYIVAPPAVFGQNRDLRQALIDGQFQYGDAIIERTTTTYDGSIRAIGHASSRYAIQGLLGRVSAEVPDAQPKLMLERHIKPGRIEFEFRIYRSNHAPSSLFSPRQEKPIQYALSFKPTLDSDALKSITEQTIRLVIQRMEPLPDVTIPRSKSEESTWQIEIMVKNRPSASNLLALVTVLRETKLRRYPFYIGSFLATGTNAQQLAEEISDRLGLSFLKNKQLEHSQN